MFSPVFVLALVLTLPTFAWAQSPINLIQFYAGSLSAPEATLEVDEVLIYVPEWVGK